MKLKTFALIGSLTLVSGCSWLYSEDGLVRDSSKDYEKAKQTQTLKLPENYDSNHIRDRLPIPQLTEEANRAKFGEELDKRPPSQILSVGQGMRIMRAKDHPGVYLMMTNDELEKLLGDFFKRKEVEFKVENGAVVSDWVLQDNEAWYRSVFGTDLPRFVRTKYKLQLNPGAQQGEVGVVVVTQERELMPYDEDKWVKVESSSRVETEFLNELIGFIDYQDRLANARNLAKLKQGISMSLGRDVDRNAALIASAEWQTVWLKTPEVLEPFGFKLNDKDRSAGQYFFEFTPNEPGFFASMFGNDDSVVLDLPAGAYQVVVGGRNSGPVTVTLIDPDGVPLVDGLMAKIYPFLTEAYGRRQRAERG
ncbi:MAG: outer membrane protein assembly factor BamC [Gammaproteobacteria bacterium]|nr:outer membrane protein assembly factor BamC [Gammaproteobacteria bacterium]